MAVFNAWFDSIESREKVALETSNSHSGTRSNGMKLDARHDDFVDVLQEKLREQSDAILCSVDARLDKQLQTMAMQWHAQTDDIGLILKSQLQYWLGGRADGSHVPIPADTSNLNDDEEEVRASVTLRIDEAHAQQKAEMHKQFAEICGWKSDGNLMRGSHQDSYGSENPFSLAQSKTHGDLVGFIPKSTFQETLAFAVHSAAFQSLSAFAVFANSIMISVQLDLDMQRAFVGEDQLPWEIYSDLSFTSLFLMEIVLRMCAEKKHFYQGNGRHWNLFDVLVVATGLIDLLEFVTFSLTFLRILRILRMLRVLRVLRIFKFCRELRLMALSIVSCLRSLVWAFLLLLMCFFIFSMVLLESGRTYLRGDSVDEGVREVLAERYSGVWICIYTLIQSVSNGVSWGEVASCWVKMWWGYGVAFTVFIVFITFGLLNVLIGVFVQNTESIAGIDREFVIQEEMERKNSLINKMRQLFKEVDVDNSGTITWKELRAKMTDDTMRAYFSTLEIEIDEAQGLFKLLDTDESGEVAIEEFIMGCLRLKGTAKSIDLAAMLYENKKLHGMLHKYMESMSTKLYQIEKLVSKRTASKKGPPQCMSAIELLNTCADGFTHEYSAAKVLLL